MIISRYLLKEVCTTIVAVTFVLVLIFLSRQLIRYMHYIALGKIAANVLLQLIGFEIPYLLVLLLPLGFYLGILLTYGRLYANNEMSVFHACGFSRAHLLFLTTLLATLGSSLVFVLALWVNPYISFLRAQIYSHTLSYEHIIQTLLPGRFQVSPDGKRVIYAERFSEDGKRAENVFIAEEKALSNSMRQNSSGTNFFNGKEKFSSVEERTQSPWVVVMASQGYAEELKDEHQRFLVAEDGYRYEGVPGKNDYKIIQFGKYSVLLPELLSSGHLSEEAISSKELWSEYHHHPDKAAELQWRISLPVSVFLLSWLAIPFSWVKPRQGKYVFILPAILIYIMYANLLFVARHWMEQKWLPISVGLWSVHGLLLLGLLLFFIFKRTLTRS